VTDVPNLVQFSYFEHLQDNIPIIGKQNLMTNLSLLSAKNFSNLKKMHLTFNDSNMLDVLMGFLSNAVTKMKDLDHIDINIFEYVGSETVNSGILRFLETLREVKGLKELYFSVDGDLSFEFSSDLVTYLTKCSQIKTLGTFSLKTTVSLLLHLFSKVSRMKSLEALVIWFSPLRGSMAQNYSVFAESIFDAIICGIKKLDRLEYINLRFPYSNFSKDDLLSLNDRLKAVKKDLSVKLGVIPHDQDDMM